jgi:hypothetical protein
MSVYIFTGPTISATEARCELEAIYLPPVAEGDVYRIAIKRPKAIGIIDGYFQSIPPVRHKEILWAMSEGIHVFGSASMGALRAAELAAFGMEGVGSIYKWYRQGVLDDDDEVAIAHGPPEAGCQPVSEAMVNIRQTLVKAQHSKIISRRVRKALEDIAKKLFYPDRTYRVLFRCAGDSGVDQTELHRLQRWLPKHRVNQKRDDAVAMLRSMRRRLTHGLKRKTVNYFFERTAVWELARTRAGRTNPNDGSRYPRSGDLKVNDSGDNGLGI